MYAVNRTIPRILTLGNHRATDGGTRDLDGWQDHGLNHHPGPATPHCRAIRGPYSLWNTATFQVVPSLVCQAHFHPAKNRLSWSC
ncbi:hypothetical protein NITMOv2_4710 [Nitrospira moscoviensis]|uniref:Uncharacterized protein n=1 Tax=Nitrospira moscoviensis TaxID=42253 RepID=A0A0K2GJQ4_NITMO|nr:hypothetical protein NITMOv2_0071 [Nitrospira moscoviensis]ALA61079.1 hypothetical protein NITMOv2_4710 [Nitrospira moscoviensis]